MFRSAPPTAASAFSLDDALAILKRRRYWLVAGLILGLALGVAALAVISPTYTAKTAVLVRPQSLSKDLVTRAPVEPVRERLQTLNERLLSHDHLVSTVEAVGLVRLDPEGEAGLLGVVDHLRRKIEVEVGNSESPYASVFRVAYAAKDSALAADVVRTLVDRFSEESVRERIEGAEATVAFLDLEIETLGQRLADTEAELPPSVTLDTTKPRPVDPVRVELGKLNRELAALLTQFTELHPAVEGKRREIALLRQQLVARPARRSSGSSRSSSASTGSDGGNAAVPRDYKRLVESYELLVARRVEAVIARDLARTAERGDYQIIEPALEPDRPSWPQPLLIGAGGALGGLLAAAALAGLWEFRTRPFYSLSTLEARVGAPVLASIPELTPATAKQREQSGYRKFVAPRILAAHDPSGIAAEQFRRLGALLVEDTKTVAVAVTSPVAGDGKSLTAANLAASIAIEIDRKVLLVDADLHRPDVAKLYKVPSGLGLLDVLRGDGSPAELVQPTAIPNLSVLLAGSAGRDSLRYFVSTEWVNFLEQARKAFDAIIIDCSPLLATVDSRFVARSADKRLVTIRHGRTPGDAALKAISELAPFDGVVFNGVERQSLRHYYYYSERNFEQQGK